MLLASTVLAASATNAPPASAHHIFRWRPFLGPFHALVLHYPIGFFTLACILEIYSLRQPGPVVSKIIRLTIWLSFYSGLMAATLGILRAAGGEYEHHAVELHRWFGVAIPVVTLLTLAAQRIAAKEIPRPAWLMSYRALMLATLGLLVVAGHYGGNLTHGSRYLVQNAPEFVKEMLEDEKAPAKTAGGPGKMTEAERLFASTIRPILETKCIRCHGPDKQKGGYRLDKPDIALKGGESGKAGIKPGDPMESNLVRVIMLPPDEDEAMPPKGKEPLSPDEVMAIVHWIQEGAGMAPEGISVSP